MKLKLTCLFVLTGAFLLTLGELGAVCVCFLGGGACEDDASTTLILSYSW
jgi:hypothetical protein